MAENKESRDEKLIEELYEKLWWYTYEASDEEFDQKEVDAIVRLLDVLEPVYEDQAYKPGAEASLKRFWERYGEEEENAAMEPNPDSEEGTFGPEAAAAEADVSVELDMEPEGDGGRKETDAAAGPVETLSEMAERSASSGRGGRWRKLLIRIAIGAAACVVLLISVNVGCYALRRKSFFEIVRDGVGRTEITVTGNTEGIEDRDDVNINCSTWKEVEEIVGTDILEPAYIPDLSLIHISEPTRH